MSCLPRVAGALLAIMLVAAPMSADHGKVDPYPVPSGAPEAVVEQHAWAHELDVPVSPEDARSLVERAIVAMDEAPDCEPWRSAMRVYWEATAIVLSACATPDAAQAWSFVAAGARWIANAHVKECSEGAT